MVLMNAPLDTKQLSELLLADLDGALTKWLLHLLGPKSSGYILHITHKIGPNSAALPSTARHHLCMTRSCTNLGEK